MLTGAKKYGSLALIAVVGAWLLYVAVGSTSFQICTADKENKQTEQAAKKNSSEVLRSLIVSARVKTDCAFVFLYDSRDAITAMARHLSRCSHGRCGVPQY
jgi:ABC-type nickel/cobalt efflux system permease component RcnA